MALDEKTSEALSAFAGVLADKLANPFKLTAEEFRRRAQHEAEIAETLSYQRHRIDKLEKRLARFEYEASLSWWAKLKRWARGA